MSKGTIQAFHQHRWTAVSRDPQRWMRSSTTRCVSGVYSRRPTKLEGVRVLLERYRAAGIYDVSHDFYPGGRHEML
jgi:hypothetical protein